MDTWVIGLIVLAILTLGNMAGIVLYKHLARRS